LRVLRHSVALATLLLVAASSRATAQGTNAGEIRGHVVNADNKTPIGRATVNVVIAGTAVSAARAPVGADGNFHVLGLRPGRYRVQIRALGYKPWESPMVDITA